MHGCAHRLPPKADISPLKSVSTKPQVAASGNPWDPVAATALEYRRTRRDNPHQERLLLTLPPHAHDTPSREAQKVPGTRATCRPKSRFAQTQASVRYR